MYDESGRPQSMYHYDGTTRSKYYFVKNLQGDVVQLRAEDNSLVAEYIYSGYGEILSINDASGNEITDQSHIANVNPIRYRGYYYDTETGFYYLRSRYYDPITCRFISPDTQLNGGLLGYNLFAYCENNPVNMYDYIGTKAYPIGFVGPIFEEDVYFDPNTIKKEIEEDFEKRGKGFVLYDSRYVNKDTPFREKIIAFEYSDPAIDITGGNIGLGSLEFDVYKGGWEFEHVNVNLFDAGHAELGLEMNNFEVNIGAMASAWSPGLDIKIFDATISLKAEVASIGGKLNRTKNSFSASVAGGLGFGIGVSWK